MSCYCLCGVEFGYPHHEDCPFPLFSEKNKPLTIVWKQKYLLNEMVRKKYKLKDSEQDEIK